MTRLANAPVFKWLLLLLSLIPVGLFAYLGNFSRLMGDDYRHFSKVVELGAWDSMVHWLQTWNGSYSVNGLHGLLEPLGAPIIPPIFPTIIIVLWLIGLSWLNLHVLRSLQVGQDRLPIAIALAALVLTATIKALHTWEPIFWYSASARYSLPVALFSIYLAATFEFAGQLHSRGLVTGAVVISAFACFITGGFSEMYLTAQFLYLTFTIAGILLMIRGPKRRLLLILIGAGFAATVASAVFQIYAPGTAARLASAGVARWAYPVRHLPDLLDQILNRTLQFTGHEDAFAGFMLLFGVGTFATLTLNRPEPGQRRFEPVSFTDRPFWFAMIMQLLFVPILWSHRSDSPELFGRFSPAYLSVVGLNIGMLVTFAFLIVLQRLDDTLLRSNAQNLTAFSGSILLAVVALFLLTQFGSIHYKAAGYLYLTSLMLLVVLGWQLSTVVSDWRVKKYRDVAILSIFVAVIAVAVPTTIGLYVYGTVFVRVLASATLLQVCSGLIWGAYVGFSIHRGIASDQSKTWYRLLKGLSLLLALTIVFSILSVQFRLIPQFATFAEEWDQQHERLLRMRENGVKLAEELPYTVDLKVLIFVRYAPASDIRWEAEYYGFEALIRSADDG